MKFKVFQLPNADITYLEDFLAADEQEELYLNLLSSLKWQQDDIKVFGKVYAQPRLTAFYGENGIGYSYSNIKMEALPFTSTLKKIKHKIESNFAVKLNCCLANLYRDGSDSNGWHADDEKELGINPVIASLSLGQARWFYLKHKNQKDQKLKILLEPGSLLLMKGETQHHWSHQIPKTKKEVGKRINLTYRYIK